MEKIHDFESGRLQMLSKPIIIETANDFKT